MLFPSQGHPTVSNSKRFPSINGYFSDERRSPRVSALDVLKVRLPDRRDKRAKTLACPAIAFFSGDGGCGLARRTLILNLALIYELETA